jgi:hypothetical protein
VRWTPRATFLGPRSGGYIESVPAATRNALRLCGAPVVLAFVALTLPAAAVGATTGSTAAGTVLPTLTTTTPSTTTTPASTAPYTVKAPASSSGSGGLSTADEIGIIVAAALLIGGIARIIMRDARSHAPAGAPPDLDRARGSVRPIEHRVKRSRAKAKNARRARRARR